MTEYQEATFDAGNGHRYPLADEVLAHLVELAMVEQRQNEKKSGRSPQGRNRPAWKRERADG